MAADDGDGAHLNNRADLPDQTNHRRRTPLTRPPAPSSPFLDPPPLTLSAVFIHSFPHYVYFPLCVCRRRLIATCHSQSQSSGLAPNFSRVMGGGGGGGVEGDKRGGDGRRMNYPCCFFSFLFFWEGQRGKRKLVLLVFKGRKKEKWKLLKGGVRGSQVEMFDLRALLE